MTIQIRSALTVVTVVLMLVGLNAGQGSRSPEALLRAAMDVETVDGDLGAAVKQYEAIVREGAPSPVMATALLRLGLVLSKQGNKSDATMQFERIVREFPAEREVVRRAEAALAQARSASSAPRTLKQVCAGSICGDVSAGPTSEGGLSPDGRFRLKLEFPDPVFVITEASSNRSRRLSPDSKRAGIELRKAIWSPDSRHVAYHLSARDAEWPGAINETRVLDVQKGSSRIVFQRGAPLAWSPDGKRLLLLLFEDGRTFLDVGRDFAWVNLDNGSLQTLSAPLRDVQFLHSTVKVSPDGQFLLYNTPGYQVNQRIYLTRADGSGGTLVSSAPNERDGELPVGWSPDGSHAIIALKSGVEFVKNSGFPPTTTGTDSPFSLWAFPVVGGKASTPILLQRDLGGVSRLTFLGITKAGVLQYAKTEPDVDLYVAGVDSTSGRVTTPPARLPLPLKGRHELARFSPDGKRLAYTSFNPAEGGPAREVGIYSFDSGRTERVLVPVDVPSRGPLCWTEDGAGLILNGAKPDGSGVEPVRVNLSTRTAAALGANAPTFSLSSCAKNFVAGRTASALAAVRDWSTGAETEIRTIAGALSFPWPVLSPDGAWVAFHETLADSRVVLRVVPRQGGVARDLAEGADLEGGRVVWSADGRFVYFGRRGENDVETFRVPVVGGPIESIGLKGTVVDVSRDGTRIITRVGSSQVQIWAMENFLPKKK